MLKKPTKKKQKWRWMRYRKGDVSHNLMCAVQRWVHVNGGTSIVMGGIAIADRENQFVPGTKGKYEVRINVLGQKPRKKADAKQS